MQTQSGVIVIIFPLLVKIDCRTRMESDTAEEVVSYFIHGIQNISMPHEELFLSGVIE